MHIAHCTLLCSVAVTEQLRYILLLQAISLQLWPKDELTCIVYMPHQFICAIFNSNLTSALNYCNILTISITWMQS